MLSNDELLFVVDAENNPIEPKPRKIVHSSGLWHRTSHIWIVNKNKEILCHQRSMKVETSPGNWDPYCGGHLAPNITYIEGALKELSEELGITSNEKELSFFKVFKNETNMEFQGIFYFVWDGDINSLKIEKDEVEQLQWLPLLDVWGYMILEKKQGWSRIAYAEIILERLLQITQ